MKKIVIVLLVYFVAGSLGSPLDSLMSDTEEILASSHFTDFEGAQKFLERTHELRTPSTRQKRAALHEGTK